MTNRQAINYSPSAVGDLLLAEDFEEPVGRAADLQVVHSGLAHAGVHQVGTGESLQVEKRKQAQDGNTNRGEGAEMFQGVEEGKEVVLGRGRWKKKEKKKKTKINKLGIV